MANVWIVEDDPRIGLLIETTARKGGHEPLRLFDAQELERALTKGAPDLLLLDLMLRGKDGFAILREWKERETTRSVPVIILSARSAEADKVRGLDLGAEDYVTKPFGVRELLSRIHAALRRVTPLPERIEAGPLTLTPDTYEVTLDGKRVDLTYLEFKLLMYLVARRGQTISRDQLLRDVWGYQFEGDPTRTVDYHIKTLRVKLSDSAAEPRLLQTVRGVGYRCIAGE